MTRSHRCCFITNIWKSDHRFKGGLVPCVSVCACVRACVRACVCVCVCSGLVDLFFKTMFLFLLLLLLSVCLSVCLSVSLSLLSVSLSLCLFLSPPHPPPPPTLSLPDSHQQYRPYIKLISSKTLSLLPHRQASRWPGHALGGRRPGRASAPPVPSLPLRHPRANPPTAPGYPRAHRLRGRHWHGLLPALQALPGPAGGRLVDRGRQETPLPRRSGNEGGVREVLRGLRDLHHGWVYWVCCNLFLRSPG